MLVEASWFCPLYWLKVVLRIGTGQSPRVEVHVNAPCKLLHFMANLENSGDTWFLGHLKKSVWWLKFKKLSKVNRVRLLKISVIPSHKFLVHRFYCLLVYWNEPVIIIWCTTTLQFCILLIIIVISIMYLAIMERIL